MELEEEMREYVLDSFAVLAYLRAEPSGPRVQELLSECDQGRAKASMTVVNLGEVLYRTIRDRGDEAVPDVLALIGRLPIEVVEIDVGLAAELGAKVVTGDREFEVFGDEVDVEWL